MRKVAKNDVSYVLAPSGSVRKGPTIGGTPEDGMKSHANRVTTNPSPNISPFFEAMQRTCGPPPQQASTCGWAQSITPEDPVDDQLQPQTCTGTAVACINPKTDDPRTWCCGCVQSMMKTCEGRGRACVKTHMCADCQVSKVWKRENECGKTFIEMGCEQTPRMPQLESPKELLNDRASTLASKSEAEGSSLDETLNDKACKESR